MKPSRGTRRPNFPTQSQTPTRLSQATPDAWKHLSQQPALHHAATKICSVSRCKASTAFPLVQLSRELGGGGEAAEPSCGTCPRGCPAGRGGTGRPDGAAGNTAALPIHPGPPPPAASLPLCSSYPQCSMALVSCRDETGRDGMGWDGRGGRTAARFEGDGR